MHNTKAHPPKEMLSIMKMQLQSARGALEQHLATQMGTPSTHRSFTSSLMPELSFLARLIMSCWDMGNGRWDTMLQ